MNQQDMSGNSLLLRVVAHGNGAMIKSLLEAGADINTRNHSGDTPLMIAVGNGNIEAVAVLLFHKAAIDVKNQHHNTALMVAAAAGTKSSGLDKKTYAQVRFSGDIPVLY